MADLKCQKGNIMTNREFYNAVIEANLNEEMTTHATHLLELLDNKNSKRAEASNKNKEENLSTARIFSEWMEGRTVAVSEVAVAFPEYNKSKISAIMKAAVSEGLFGEIDGYKVGGKGRNVKGYYVKPE